ncbi:hypothetical protein QBC40DRAFT_266506 [Triangularia verruculosa]|uniref:Uncharacterized protein n=1 Tax=Triangularia verruculosa TaxID=2587418 RepID=A0AAN7ATQ0_9PEZI|nr:hypothetical protein QBC40DRAFT_266506 [Triangularia verruculosa]
MPARHSLLSNCQLNLQESEEKYGLRDDRSLSVLTNYMATAYYLYHDNALTWSLATHLWQRTMDWDGESWGPQAKGMWTASSMMVRLCSTTSDFKRKTHSQIRALMRREGCNPKTKAGRRKWRQICAEEVVASEQDVFKAAVAIQTSLSVFSRHFDARGWVWDCKSVAQSLRRQYDIFAREFTKGEEQPNGKTPSGNWEFGRNKKRYRHIFDKIDREIRTYDDLMCWSPAPPDCEVEIPTGMQD